MSLQKIVERVVIENPTEAFVEFVTNIPSFALVLLLAICGSLLLIELVSLIKSKRTKNQTLNKI